MSSNNQMLSENSVPECSSISIEKNTEGKTIDNEVCTPVKLTETEEQNLLKEKFESSVERNVTLTENIIDQVTHTPIIPKVLQEQSNSQL